ncbi:MAG: Gfo/Idh/MocA family oxidoreductase [Rhizobium sp.]|nr:Gfo/Idh/MocA family oxidoreductase [Rhizobium sp.]MBX9469111.1 Gfo/Idh/MocA family oxidoreductase [Rhizobium sp.]
MRWALIGASTIARQYMVGAIRAQHGEISHVLSASAERARAFADEHHIPRSGNDLKEPLSAPHIDAVYISTTNEKHLQQALAAVKAGKHVLCEKPLALTLDDASAMVRAAREAGLVFATNHHLRCSGSHRAVRGLIASGRIGRVLSLRLHHAVFLPPHLQGWRINSPNAGGGVIPDITVHDADVARFLLGEDPISVVAQMTSSGLGEGVEDSAMSVWTMPSGAMVMSHESFTHPFAGSGLEVHGTEGSIFARDVMTQNPIGSIELVTASGREVIGFDQHDLYGESIRRFHAAVAGDGEPAATGLDGVKSLAVALAVREAAARGVRIDVNYGDVR